MVIHSVDERDSQEEMIASGYRVMIIRPGRRVSAFNVDDVSVTEALQWAGEQCIGNERYSLAARFDNSGGGATLVWLTQPPEAVMDTAGE